MGDRVFGGGGDVYISTPYSVKATYFIGGEGSIVEADIIERSLIRVASVALGSEREWEGIGETAAASDIPCFGGSIIDTVYVERGAGSAYRDRGQRRSDASRIR